MCSLSKLRGYDRLSRLGLIIAANGGLEFAFSDDQRFELALLQRALQNLALDREPPDEPEDEHGIGLRNPMRACKGIFEGCARLEERGCRQEKS